MFDDILDRKEKWTMLKGAEGSPGEPMTFGYAGRGYQCPKHGDIEYHIITSTIPKFEGTWCMLCILEWFDKLGIHRVERVD